MQPRNPEQLDKILALADSSHDGEAVGAVRMARQMLSRDGLSFSDLARAATLKPRFPFTSPLFYSSMPNFEAKLTALQLQCDELCQENAVLRQQLAQSQRRNQEMEQNLSLTQSDARRWKQLASDTVEKLWEIGRELKSQEFDADSPAPATLQAQK